MTAEPGRDDLDWPPFAPDPDLLLWYGTRKLDREFKKRMAEERAEIDAAVEAARAARAAERAADPTDD